MRWMLIAAVMLSACSSNPADPGVDGGARGDGIVGDSTGPGGHAVCGAAPPPELGQSCSASGMGDLCTDADAKCGSLSCVIDARQGATKTYCAPGCTTEEDCPLGYACTAQHAQCVGAVTGKVCTQSGEMGCSKVTLPAGKALNQSYASLFEDGAGHRYLVAGNYQSTAALYRQEAGTWTELHSWSEGMDTDVRGVANGANSTLVLVEGRLLLIAAGVVTEEPLPVARQLFVSVDDSGAFVALEPVTSGAGYATLWRRSAAGKWDEVGPTSKKLTRAPSSLGRGFVGLCGAQDQSYLCTSVDGEAFEELELPLGTSLSAAGAPAAGRSTDDFYIVLSGVLYHRAGGAWLEEGVASGTIPKGSYHAKTVLLLADGSVVYGRYEGEDSSTVETFLLTGGCWQPVNVAFPATPWGGTLARIRSGEICLQPTH